MDLPGCKLFCCVYRHHVLRAAVRVVLLLTGGGGPLRIKLVVVDHHDKTGGGGPPRIKLVVVDRHGYNRSLDFRVLQRVLNTDVTHNTHTHNSATAVWHSTW